MGEALSALLVQSIPYLAPLVLGLLGLAVGALWRWILQRIKNATAAAALASLGVKAKTIAEALEQTMRPQLAAATADGRLTREEASQLATVALRHLLELAGSELGILRSAGGLSAQQAERVAQLALEAEVYRLPSSSHRLGRGGPVGELR